MQLSNAGSSFLSLSLRISVFVGEVVSLVGVLVRIVSRHLRCVNRRVMRRPMSLVILLSLTICTGLGYMPGVRNKVSTRHMDGRVMSGNMPWVGYSVEWEFRHECTLNCRKARAVKL